MPKQDRIEEPHRLQRRDMLRFLGAIVPAAGVLGACSDDVVAGTDTGAVQSDAAAKPDSTSSPDAALPDGAPGDALLPDGVTAPDLKKCSLTKGDAEGPFFEKGSPSRSVLAGAKEPGDRTKVSGKVTGPDCTTPLVGAIVDVWHADASGQYHSAGTTYRLRGQMKTGSKGEYQFETIRPGQYSGRPRHYHLMITMPGHKPLTTQIYFGGDPLLGPKDSCQPPTCDSSDKGRVVTFAKSTSGGKTEYSGAFDITLAKA